MIVKVKEPLPQEYPLLRKDQVLFTYLHLAPAPELTKALLDCGVIGIAYETCQLANGSLPLLTPMSEVAGRLSVQVGAHWLQKENGGSGVLLGGVPGTPPANVTIVGGGMVGINAAKMALGMGAHVTILDLTLDRLRYLDDVLGGRHHAAGLQRLQRREGRPRGRRGHRRPAHPGRQSQEGRHQGAHRARCAKARSSWTWPSTRAGAWKGRGPPPTTTRSSTWTE